MWEHPEKFRVCGACVYFLLKNEDNGLGLCRRHAPNSINGFPYITKNDWCGDHRINFNIDLTTN